MSFIAILGGGAIGGALAHKLALRGRVRDVRLIDPHRQVAEGKALDILQSSPIDRFQTRVSGNDRLESAAGAEVIIVADAADGSGEHAGETALAMLRRIAAMDAAAPLLFAGASQCELMGRVVSELHVAGHRVIGSAPVALESSVSALTALELDATGAEVQIRIAGVPPRRAVIAWEEATAFGQPLTALVPPHRLAAVSARLPSLWPPGPLTLAAAASRVAEALANGSRRRFSCFVALEEPPVRGVIAAMPVALAPRGIQRIFQPLLTRQERTVFENGLAMPGISRI